MKNDDCAADGWEFKYVHEIKEGDEVKQGTVTKVLSGSITTSLQIDHSRTITKHPLSSMEVKK